MKSVVISKMTGRTQNISRTVLMPHGIYLGSVLAQGLEMAEKAHAKYILHRTPECLGGM